ncbi:MAG: flagellar biosynthetic protein FliR [Sandaracinaceae bacterium]
MQPLIEELVPRLPYAFLVMLRVSVMMASLPAPFGSGAPAQVRLAVALVLTGALVAPTWESAPHIAPEAVTLGRVGIVEALIGAVIGLTIRVTLAAAEVAGNIAGLSMGQGFAATVDPNFGEQVLPPGRLFGSLAVLFFFALNGHHVAIRALGWSLVHVPVGSPFRDAVHAGILEIGTGLMAQGLRIASPIVGAMFIVQLGLGLVAKSAQKVQVFALSFAIMSAVGAAVLFASLPAVGAAIGEVIGTLPSVLEQALGG